VTHLCYESGPDGNQRFSPEAGLLAELAPFAAAWDT